MELALAYALMDKRRREEKERTQALQGIDPKWWDFHASEAHTVSVFAGRGTGKTYNIALRAVRSPYDAIIYTVNKEEEQILKLYLERILQENGIDIQRLFHRSMTRTSTEIELKGGKRIFIHDLESCIHFIPGDNWRNKDIYVSEFEHADLQRLMEMKEPSIRQARQILCVGSMTRIGDSFAKRWFNDSDARLYVDAEDVPPEMEYNRQEFIPSFARAFIDHLPPRDYAFL